ncbi:hypothetical protein Nmel_000816 [Mimus melanotis]
MVLLSGHGERLAGERVCPAPAAAKEMPGAGAESSPEQGAAETAAEEPDGEEEEEEEDYEYEDFSELPDTCSIASDDSFYPPGRLDDDDEDLWSLEGDGRDSPEALSLFRACCTNNSIVLKALIRQGPQEEEVREADRNRRLATPEVQLHITGYFEDDADTPILYISAVPGLEPNSSTDIVWSLGSSLC